MRYWIRRSGAPRTTWTRTNWRACWSPRATPSRRRRPGRTSWSPTPARSSKRPARSRSRRSSRWPTRNARARATRRHWLHGRALRRRTRDRAARSRPRRGFRRESDGAPPRRLSCCARERCRLRPLESSASEVGDALGLREDRRRVRPTLRILRHPVLSRRPALSFDRGDPDRGPRARRRRRTRTGPDRPGPRELGTRPTSRRSRRTGRGARRGRHAAVDRTDPDAGREVDRVRLLYLYPSGLTGGLIDAILESGVPYFDLSLQHASRPLLRAMRRWGDAERFLERIAAIRRANPTRPSARRSSWATPVRPRTTSDGCSSSSTRRNSTGPASSPSPPKRARPPTRWATRSRTNWRSSDCVR